EGAKLERFSYVEPVVMCVVSELMISFRISRGLGVVVMTHFGSSPILSPNMSISQVSLGYCHAASSSHHAVSCCGPRSCSGSWPEKMVAFAPLGHVNLRL